VIRQTTSKGWVELRRAGKEGNWEVEGKELRPWSRKGSLSDGNPGEKGGARVKTYPT